VTSFSSLSMRLVPNILVNGFLMLRWRCLIHPSAVILYPFGCRIAKGARIGRCKVICNGAQKVSVALGRVYVHDGAIIDANNGWIEIGDDTTINPYCVLYGGGGLKIGAHCGIATQSVVVASAHTFERSDLPIMNQQVTGKGIIIEDDVWLGAGCRVLDGVVIRKGTVVGAGAVVTRDSPPGAVIVGVPARQIKVRGATTVE
jgi:acetyltransferase-like isoleucine patch superfamily enzyme